MSLIKLTRKENNKLSINSIGKFVKPLETFAPMIICYGMYSSKNNAETIKELETNLIIQGDSDANAYEIGKKSKNDNAIHAVAIYRIRNSTFRKAMGLKTTIFSEIKEFLTEEF